MMFCRNRLKRIKASILFCGLTLLSSISFSQDTARTNNAVDNKIRNIDGVAAVVNTGYVTRKEIDDRIAALKKQGVKLPDDGSLRKTILERLIIEKVQLQNAEQDGIKVSNKELDKIIGDIAAKNKMTYAEFKAKVSSSGTTFERYKELLRDDIIVSRYREYQVEGKIKISDAEIDNFIADRTREMLAPPAPQSAPPVKGGPEEIDVAQIFIPVETGAGAGAQADAKKKADALLRQARGDVDLCSLEQ